MATDEDVIQLFPDAEKGDHEAPITKRDKEPGYCSHVRVELDDAARRIYCRDCGDEVPAFDAMLSLHYEWARYVRTRKEARRGRDIARKEEAEAKRLEANTKARLARARASLESEAPLRADLAKMLDSLDAQLERSDPGIPGYDWAVEMRLRLAALLEEE